jgi:hypothetical protein
MTLNLDGIDSGPKLLTGHVVVKAGRLCLLLLMA